MDTHTLHFERLTPREGMTPQNPPRVRIVGPYDARVMGFIREVPRHERAFDPEHQAWRVSLTGPARLSRLARVVSHLKDAEVSPAITSPAISQAVNDYRRRMAPIAEREREQDAGATFSVEVDRDSVLLRFDYHKDWNAAVRGLPSAMRAFDRQDKGWRVVRNPEALNALAEQAHRHGFPANVRETLDAIAREGRQTRGSGEASVTPVKPKKDPSALSFG